MQLPVQNVDQKSLRSIRNRAKFCAKNIKRIAIFVAIMKTFDLWLML